jgi:thiol-disulfide isomerase/thioredoxin
MEDLCSGSRSLKVKVFTSSNCTFCQEALDTAREVADKFNHLNLPVEVIETAVEENPDLIETYNAIALPMILVGSAQIIGLPKDEDIEFLIHQMMLAG